MTDHQVAILWWRQLFTELGTAAETGTLGPLGLLARQRCEAINNLLFGLLKELPISCFLEIGAHNAEASKKFVTLKTNGYAAAYEAVPEIYARVLGQGVPDRLTMHNSAVGSETGTVRFYIPTEDRLKVWSSTRKRVGTHEVREITVPMIALDEAASRMPRIGTDRDMALWIDVEGSGLDILSGAAGVLSQRASIVYIEVNDIAAYEGGATSLEIIALLLKQGFVPVARDNQYGDAWNLLAVHEASHYAVRETIARWHYKHSGFATTTNWIMSSLAKGA